MSEPLRRAWTQDEFFDWEGHDGGRYEFDGIQPVAMTGGSVAHARMIRRLHAAVASRLAGGRCEFLGPDAGVATVGKTVRYPDGLISCAPLDDASKLVPGVVVAFEIVSPGSSRVDRIVKVREYAAVETMRRYVIIESTTIGVMVLHRERADQGWTVAALTEADAIELPEVGVVIPVSELYADVRTGGHWSEA